MKKLVVLLAAMALVVAFGMPAAAHDLCCYDCSKCYMGTIDCPTSATNQTGSCTWFDYDETTTGETTTAMRNGAYGYVPYPGLEVANINCKVLFDICCCTDSLDAFVEDNTIGIRMTSLTSGFYFTSDRIYQDSYSSRTLACEPYTMADPKEFANGSAYEYYLDAARTTAGYPAPKSTSCSVPAANRAVVVQTPSGTGYVIQAGDVSAKECWWWLDMPAMKYDSAVAVPGAEVAVQIDLLASATLGICGEWKVICTCVVYLGVYCEEEPEECCLLFPYVLTQSSPWNTGITLINLDVAGVPAADMRVDMTLTDATGAEYTYSKSDFDADQVIWTFSLDAILSEFSGTPAAGRAFLKLEPNFQAHGYMFLTNGAYAGGTYADDCYGPCVEK